MQVNRGLWNHSGESLRSVKKSLSPGQKEERLDSRAHEVVKACKAQLKLRLDRLADLRNRCVDELADNGNFSEEVTFENLLRVVFMSFLLAASLIGEFIFARWTIAPFRLGDTETIFVAVTMIIITAMRKSPGCGAEPCQQSRRWLHRSFPITTYSLRGQPK